MLILWILGVVTIAFAFVFVKDAWSRKDEDNCNPLIATGIGFVTDFLDTLGVGSFAPTTALLKVTKQIDDRLLPGTLNVSHTLPVIFEAFVFITVVEVEMLTLTVLIVSAVIGSYIGAGVISKLPKRNVKIVMGVALILVAVTMIMAETGFIAGLGEGNTALGLTGAKLVITAVLFFILGALMSAGVGLYAPAMAVVYFMGMSPLVAFPIMMGSCAFLMPVGSVKFIKEKAYAPKLSLFITLGGLVGVFIAAFMVKSMDLALLTKVVIVVIIITGISMLYEVFVKDAKESKE
ncbi:MAG: TSUP family transporter [Lachnospirales bacterium]